MCLNNIYRPSPEKHNYGNPVDPNISASYGQVPSTEQFSHRNSSEEVNVNAQGVSERETDPAFGSRSAVNYGTSALVPGQEPEYDPYAILTPSEVKPWDKITSTPMSLTSVGSLSENVNSNFDSHAPPFPFPVPSYLKPQYGMSFTQLLINHFANSYLFSGAAQETLRISE